MRDRRLYVVVAQIIVEEECRSYLERLKQQVRLIRQSLVLREQLRRQEELWMKSVRRLIRPVRVDLAEWSVGRAVGAINEQGNFYGSNLSGADLTRYRYQTMAISYTFRVSSGIVYVNTATRLNPNAALRT